MTRSWKSFRLHWQQAIIVIVTSVAIRLSSGSQNCSGEPCMYGICMNNANGSYLCYCIDGYTGINCEINWDDCWSDPCMNGGTCNDAVASFNCTCPDGFIGLNCEQKYSECMNQPCLNNGTCIDYNGFTCQCPEGYSGDFCEIDVSVCNNTICRNAGECVEGPGFSFYCRCTEGWTGPFCEEDVDECIASPCQNGGLCLNVPATYTCACLFGFTGKDCDKSIVPCEENPCKNDAMCLLEDSQPVCYCVPDYHGQLCELRYNDCESKFAICENGGTCIDGINNFTCACPPAYGGRMCVDYDPTAITSPGTTIGWTVERFNSTAKTVPSLPTIIYLTSLETASNSPTMTTPMSTSSSTTSSTFLQQNSTASTIDEYDVGSTSDKFNYSHAGDSTEKRMITTAKSVSDNRVDENWRDGTGIDRGTSSTMSYIVPISDTESPTVPPTDIQEITSRTATVSGSIDGSTVFQLNDTSIPIIMTTVSIKTGLPINDTNRGSTSEDKQDITTILSVNAIETTTPIDSNVSGYFGTSSTFPTAPTNDVESRGFPDRGTPFETSVGSSSHPTEASTNVSFVTHPIAGSTSSDTDHRSSSPSIPQPEMPRHYNCSQEECRNTTCPRNETFCNCDFVNRCKDGPSIENAAFNGKSYVRQQVAIDENGILQIFVRLKTKSKSGVLVHAFFDDERYVLLYMESGQLKFQFSCGLQTMLLGEIDSPINSGHDVDVEMRFQYLVAKDDVGKCSARLLVNNSMAMSGEQILISHENIPRQVRIHLGGIPQAFSHYFPRIAMGFVGCMSIFRINNVPRHFIHDSIETFQIEECTSFLCLLNPCRNFGSCHDIDGQVYCKCIAGYSGAVCERTACDDNPCYLGSTCISSPGTGFICVCPLGMHGLLCEEESAIVQPSFSVFIPGFSSYAAYGITNAIKDGMELRMRLLPHSLDQISLIAFMGQSGTSREIPDHFSVTYVRGYIMLTWDLGSGVRRIFTKSPLRTRAHRPHTLRVGRRGRDAWLSVDGLGNVTGQAAGSMTQLDVSPILYVGGHKARNFETLPHDLPLHTGFTGCIFDIELRTEEAVFQITKSSPATGRGVGECHRNECSHNACKNGALCLNHGPTYSCVCMKEWEGADCSIPAITCSSSSPYKCQKANILL